MADAGTSPVEPGNTDPPATPPVTPPASPEAPPVTPAPEAGWLSDELKGNEAFKDFKSADDLAKAHLDVLEKSKPPETAEAYKLEIPDSIKVDTSFVGAAKGWAKEAGLSQAQFEKFAGKYMENQAAVEKAVADAQARDAATLRSEWGGEYDANMETALKAARTFVGEEFAAAMREDPVLSMVKAFHRIGSKITDDTFNPPAEGGAASADAKLKKLYPSMYK